MIACDSSIKPDQPKNATSRSRISASSSPVPSTIPIHNHAHSIRSAHQTTETASATSDMAFSAAFSQLSMDEGDHDHKIPLVPTTPPLHISTADDLSKLYATLSIHDSEVITAPSPNTSKSQEVLPVRQGEMTNMESTSCPYWRNRLARIIEDAKKQKPALSTTRRSANMVSADDLLDYYVGLNFCNA